jgi:DNA-binding winged helix-turn-helix (wHTH) protein/TolB-like protein
MIYRFGLFTFDPNNKQLTHNGQLVPLEPQPAKALAAFLAKPNEILSKEELRLALWGPEHHVDVDRGIAYCLSELRSALRDNASSPLYIQTLPRRGYRFIAPLSGPLSAPLAQSEPPVQSHTRRNILIGAGAAGLLAYSAWELLRQSQTSIAVSIFDNESEDPSLDQWTASLSDTVLVQLSKLAPSRLGLIGNAASLRRPRNIRNLKALASELDVNYILLGQLKRAEDSLAFVTHLIRLPGEVHLKANRLRGSKQNLPALEREILAEFDRAVRVHVLGEAAN